MSIGRSSTASAPDTSRESGSRRRWLILAVVAGAQLLIVLDGTIVNIALPAAQQALDISDANRQWMVTAYALAFGALLLLGGRIADYTGRKRAFIIGLLGFAAASAVGGLAQNEAMLFAARALQGAFGALMAPAALSLLTVTFTDAKERARAFGVYGAIAGGGGAAGLLLGGVLTEYASWRWTLLVSTPVAIVTAVAAARYLIESRADGDTKYDLPGAITSTAGLAALVYGFTKAADDGWDSATTIAFLITGVALLVVFVLIETRSQHPLLPMRVILDRNRGGAFLASFMIGIGLFGFFLFLSFYLQQTLGYSALMTGVAFLPFTGGIVAGAGLSTLLSRLGPRLLMSGGLLIAAIGMALLTRIGVDTSYWTHVLPAEMLISFGAGVAFGPMNNTSLLGVADQDAGVASALSNTTQQIGGSIGTALLNTIFTSALAGYLADHASSVTGPDQLPVLQTVATVHSYTVAFWVSAGLIALASAVAFVLICATNDERTGRSGAHVAI